MAEVMGKDFKHLGVLLSCVLDDLTVYTLCVLLSYEIIKEGCTLNPLVASQCVPPTLLLCQQTEHL